MTNCGVVADEQVRDWQHAPTCQPQSDLQSPGVGPALTPAEVGTPLKFCNCIFLEQTLSSFVFLIYVLNYIGN